MSKLNEVRCRTAKPHDEIYMLNDGHGLYLRIYPSGHKAFVLRQRNKIKTLGEYSAEGMTLRDARQIAHGDAKVNALKFNRATVGHLLREFFEVRIEPRYKRPEELEHYLFTDLAVLANKKIVDVTRKDLATILRDKAKNGGPVAANRLLSIVKRVFRFAMLSGIVEVNPAELLDREMAGGQEHARERTLNDAEIKQLWWSDLRYRSLLRFLLASGQRITEARDARWRDVRDGKWHLPDTKSNRAHWVAVSPTMQAELDARPDGEPDDLIFGSTRTSVQACLKRWQRREKIESRWTAHDLRRTMVTRMNDAGVAPFVVEKIVNHQLTGVMKIYNRASYEPERIAAQTLWSDLLQKIVGTEQDALDAAVAELLDTTRETRGRPKEDKLYAEMYAMIYRYKNQNKVSLEKSIQQLAAAKTKTSKGVFAEDSWRNALKKYRNTAPALKVARMI